jgi:hypothetical protein
MKVEELKGADLDYWFGRASGLKDRIAIIDGKCWIHPIGKPGPLGLGETIYNPTENWNILGPLVSTNDIYLVPTGNSIGSFSNKSDKRMYKAAMRGASVLGPTAEEAICRAFIIQVIGTEVPDQ